MNFILSFLRFTAINILYIFRWYPLQGKNKVCGELQVKIAFTVRSGSLLDLTKKDKHKLSVGQLSSTASNISRSSVNC